jgi:hypothetical protein
MPILASADYAENYREFRWIRFPNRGSALWQTVLILAATNIRERRA